QPRAGMGVAVFRAGLRDLAHRGLPAAADRRRDIRPRRDTRLRAADGGRGVTLAINIFLWGVVVVLGTMAALRGTALFRDNVRESVIEYVRLLPRIALGVIGSGFIAEAMPQDIIVPWIGPASGLLGVAIATIGGACTSGGPVVGFSIA